MPTAHDPASLLQQPLKARLLSVMITIALGAGLCWSVILSGNLSGRGASDDLLYHWVAINQFAQQWPSPNIGDYASATTPGYHLILAPLVRAGLDHTGIQIAASLWTLALLGLLSWVVSRAWGQLAWVLMLPMIASLYVLYPGIWLLPDNAGWLAVLGVLLLALRPRSGPGVLIGAGVLLMALVVLRQVHIWAAGVVWLAAWLGDAAHTPRDPRSFFSVPIERLGRTIIAQGMTIPAFVVLIYFLGTWGGLVPPSFQNMHQGPNPATPGFVLLQVAILSVFFAPVLLPGIKQLWAHHWRWLLLAGLVGLVLGVAPHSSYSFEQGRYSGWWNTIKLLPTIADRSPLFVVGSVAGAMALVLWLNLAPLRDRWIWLGVLCAFTLAQSANHASWQRYHEPMLLMMIVLILARSSRAGSYRTRVILGSIALTAMLGGITISSMMTAEPIDPGVGTPETTLNTQLRDPGSARSVSILPASHVLGQGRQLSVNRLALPADATTITARPGRTGPE